MPLDTFGLQSFSNTGQFASIGLDCSLPVIDHCSFPTRSHTDVHGFGLTCKLRNIDCCWQHVSQRVSVMSRRNYGIAKTAQTCKGITSMKYMAGLHGMAAQYSIYSIYIYIYIQSWDAVQKRAGPDSVQRGQNMHQLRLSSMSFIESNLTSQCGCTIQLANMVHNLTTVNLKTMLVYTQMKTETGS